MLEACEHMAEIISNLTAFSRESKGKLNEFSELNLNDVIESTLSFSSQLLIKSKIKIIKNYSNNLLLIHGDKRQLQQVFLNLIANAKDAMLNGGEFIINTYNLKDKNKIVYDKIIYSIFYHKTSGQRNRSWFICFIWDNTKP